MDIYKQLTEKSVHTVHDKFFKCPLCGKVTRGKRGLNIHLRRIHFPDKSKISTTKQIGLKRDYSRDKFNKRNELKIQEILVKTVYGSAKVNQVVKDYIAGKYSQKNLPINISYYLRLKGIKPEHQIEQPEKKLVPVKSKSDEKQTTITAANLLTVLERTPETGDDWSSTTIGIQIGQDSFEYVTDLVYDISKRHLLLQSSTDATGLIQEEQAIQYLSEALEEFDYTDLKNSMFIIKHMNSIAKRIYQKVKGTARWIVIDFTDKKTEKD